MHQQTAQQATLCLVAQQDLTKLDWSSDTRHSIALTLARERIANCMMRLLRIEVVACGTQVGQKMQSDISRDTAKG